LGRSLRGKCLTLRPAPKRARVDRAKSVLALLRRSVLPADPWSTTAPNEPTDGSTDGRRNPFRTLDRARLAPPARRHFVSVADKSPAVTGTCPAGAPPPPRRRTTDG